jgi:uncharacterized protein YndB with AHSA1/START domain
MSKPQITAEPGTPVIVIDTEFDAPAELLLKAHTDPELVAQWLGPRNLRTRIDEYDVGHGGRWRMVHIDEDGTEYGFRGVHHGTPSLDGGISRTFEYEGMPGHVCFETLTFQRRDGKTVLHVVSLFQSVEDRDGMLASGMETGMTEAMEQLAELLPRLAKVS